MAHAQVPHMLNYQGFLTDPGGTPVTASVPMVFKLYKDAAGGSDIYSETQTVAVNAGIFDVVIGAAIPLNLDFDVPYYLGVAVGVDSEMAPRQLVTASPYALRSANADALAPAATVAGSQITGSIASATLPAGNLTGPIVTAQIANNAVTQAKLSPIAGAAAGKVLGTDGSNLQWQTTNTGTVTSVGTSSGLTGGPITSSGTINLAATQLLPAVQCLSTQIPKWNGSAWQCDADRDFNHAVNDTRYFKQDGNTFGATGVLGINDAFPLELRAGGARVMRYEPSAISPNLIGGSPANNVTTGVRGATIAGGGIPPGDTDPSFAAEAPNRVTDAY
ncbi:MAG: hypothetical protein IPM02_21645, partial [Betaproteobacteria bacterium]|nr:hypothetical protein [Betaproteobacteria bacterium]